MKNSLIIGTQYSLDLKRLSVIGKWNDGLENWYIKLSYENGLISDILFSSVSERDEQYSEIVKRWKVYRGCL